MTTIPKNVDVQALAKSAAKHIKDVAAKRGNLEQSIDNAAVYAASAVRLGYDANIFAHLLDAVEGTRYQKALHQFASDYIVNTFYTRDGKYHAGKARKGFTPETLDGDVEPHNYVSATVQAKRDLAKAKAAATRKEKAAVAEKILADRLGSVPKLESQLLDEAVRNDRLSAKLQNAEAALNRAYQLGFNAGLHQARDVDLATTESLTEWAAAIQSELNGRLSDTGSLKQAA